MRDVTKETNKVITGTSPAARSYQAPFYHLLDPDFVRRVAERKRVGAVKYGSVQYRQGLNDPQYVADAINHLFDHLLKFLADGNTKDDNLGAAGWALDLLCTVERECPEVLQKVVGTCHLIGEAATQRHLEEMAQRNAKKAA